MNRRSFFASIIGATLVAKLLPVTETVAAVPRYLQPVVTSLPSGLVECVVYGYDQYMRPVTENIKLVRGNGGEFLFYVRDAVTIKYPKYGVTDRDLIAFSPDGEENSNNG